MSIIAGTDEALRQQLVEALGSESPLPPFKTENSLGDYSRRFDAFDTETDIKTKVLVLGSNPKAYNLDKMLEFLSIDRSVLMFYFVGVDPGKLVDTVMVSMFQEMLLRSTVVLRHWSGRNSRGVTQFEGKSINELILRPESAIDSAASVDFLKMVIDL